MRRCYEATCNQQVKIYSSEFCLVRSRMLQGEQVHLRLLSEPGFLEFCLCAHL